MCALRTGEPALIQGPIIFIQPKISSILCESVAQAMPLCHLSRPSQPGCVGCGLKRCEDESHADSDVSRSSGSVALVGTPSGGESHRAWQHHMACAVFRSAGPVVGVRCRFTTGMPILDQHLG